jgi:hypothetical protein
LALDVCGGVEGAGKSEGCFGLRPGKKEILRRELRSSG